MKKTALLFCMGLLLIVSSCKKDMRSVNESASITPEMQQSNVMLRSAAKPGDVLYRASDKSIEAQQANNLRNFLEGYNRNNTIASKPGVCPNLLSSSCILKSATLVSGSFCNNDAQVAVVYSWVLLESFTYVNPFTYTFTVNTGMNNYTGTAVFIGEASMCNRDSITPCPVYKHYEVMVVMTGAEYGFSQTTNTASGVNGCTPTPQVLSASCSLDFPNSYYTDYPARVIISDGSGFVFIGTECSLICPLPPHTTCPSSGTFYYKRTIDSIWLSTSIPSSGKLFFLPAGNYDYRAVLNYGAPVNGSSQEKTGTFTVN